MKILISVDGRGLVGELETFESRGVEAYQFRYHPEWVQSGFQVDPELPLVADMPFHSKRLWGVFQDISPDRWGRLIQQRAQKRYLTETDYLLGVSDRLRMGALRLALADRPGRYIADRNDVPKLIHIRTLEAASRRVESGIETNADLTELIGAGSSLGGAHPKAVIEDDGCLYLAKFQPKSAIERTGAWEATLLDLAMLAGQVVPEHRLLNKEGDSPIVLVKRFDRLPDGGRLHYASAMTLAGLQDGEGASYVELSGILSNVSAKPQQDSFELWKRMVFNAMVGNTDDHLRNHGFLRVTDGWSLSPVFDLNPDATPFGRRAHALAFLPGEVCPSFALLEEAGAFFNLGESDMKQALVRIANALKQWRAVATRNGLSEREISRTEGAFEHQGLEDLCAAGCRPDGQTFHKHIPLSRLRERVPRRGGRGQ
ncbi:MAG: type II toxin-antitoxin system HipA family toxin [Betaproteobacteria bacterium]|nr:type II toxin-antitoxin system HipA family toxin [Betaproteobacteria bacterium]